ncbi:BBE domain-containing protein [Kitasatospora sp. NPDC052868]|uniref:BBE domain-containing protein n=1 Tax=Kitasatospora sp. NPDC052868 TaxID=3364060 RepID=UPI0037C70A88
MRHVVAVVVRHLFSVAGVLVGAGRSHEPAELTRLQRAKKPWDDGNVFHHAQSMTLTSWPHTQSDVDHPVSRRYRDERCE